MASLLNFAKVLLEAVVFGVIVVLIGIIIAKILELWITVVPTCNDNHFYEIALFFTGFVIHLLNVYVVNGWLA